MSREILENIIEDFNLEKFVHFFRNKNRAFAPKKEELNQNDNGNLRNGVKLGEIDFSGNEQMIICAFETTQDLTERSGKKAQYKEGKKILKERQYDAGIFIFYDQNGNFRFSLIYANYSGTRRDWSEFRRFTYFVSKELTNKTFLERIGGGNFSSLDKIKEAFSVEKVTKEFYNEIANWYFWALKEARFPIDAESVPKGRNIALIRLITRLIFIWFMRQKGIVKRELFDRKFLDGILKDLSANESTYYLAILQNLFFATLNTPIEQRKFRREQRYKGYLNKDYMEHFYFRHHSLFKNPEEMKELFNDIPFLNGGLFECLDRSKDEESNDTGREIRIDGFSDDQKKQPYMPNFLFFSDERDVDLNEDYRTKNKRYRAKGIISILKSYNFTIDENTPVDEEVALDPELLGRVFENLLASYNPETETTARKATGSYYTPREIVDYMVKESLKEYFKTQVTGIDEEKLNTLFLYDDASNPFSDEKTTEQLINAIHNLKLLDPAVGSGAFPMGVLHALVNILHKLDSRNERWKAGQIKSASSITDPKIRQETLKRIEDSFTLNELDYGRKLYLIQNCIFGVDIQPIAIQIAKLRFFISLLVDEKVDRSKLNSGIEPLPNLETKFVAANTLIGLTKPKQLSLKSPDVKKLEDELKEIRNEYFIAISSKEKDRLKKKDAEARKALTESLKSSGFPAQATERIARWNPYDTNKSADWFDPKWMYGITGGFDIMIGNPPYLRIQEIQKNDPELAVKLKDSYRSASGSFDIYACFVEFAINHLSEDGNIAYILPHKFFQAAFGKNLRKIISSGKYLRKIVDFGSSQVFEFATTYTCLLFLSRDNKDFVFAELKPNVDGSDLQNVFVSIDQSTNSDCVDVAVIAASEATEKEWHFSAGKVSAILAKLRKQPRTLADVCDKIFQGIATSADNIYFLRHIAEHNGMITAFSESLNSEVSIEKGTVKPLLKGADIHRYDKLQPNIWCIFPYKVKDGKAILYTQDEIKKRFPKAWAYLLENRKDLENREHGRMAHNEFYAYIYPKNLTEFEKPKIITPEISYGCNMTYDLEGIYHNTKCYSFVFQRNIKESPLFFLALLNSKLLWYFLASTGYVLRGGYFVFKTNYLMPFPIPRELSQESQAPFIRLVEYIMYLKQMQSSDKVPNNTSHNSLMVSYFEQLIDAMVYELYFEDEMKKANKEFISLLIRENLPDIISMRGDASDKLRAIFEKLFDKEHSLRKNLFFLDSLETIRIIEGKNAD